MTGCEFNRDNNEDVISSEQNILIESSEKLSSDIPLESEENSISTEVSPGETQGNGDGGLLDDLLILVGPKNYIPDEYIPNLSKVQGKYEMNILAASHAKDLIADAKKAGFDLQICSAYRTIEKSEELYKRKVNQYIASGYSEEDAKKEAAMWVAPPGTSEHHTGLAMDIVSSDYWGYYSDLEYDFDKFDSFKWLYENCANYGFILRYPKGKSELTGIVYEPWHYRYVGNEAASYIMENGLCLEEYLDQIR